MLCWAHCGSAWNMLTYANETQICQMMPLSLICCGEERKWTDIWSHLPLQHRVWLRSLCQVNGHWQMLGSGPSSLILALEGVLVEFSTCLKPDIEIRMHMHAIAPMQDAVWHPTKSATAGANLASSLVCMGGRLGAPSTPLCTQLSGHQQKNLSVVVFPCWLERHLPACFRDSYFAYSYPCCSSLYFVLLLKQQMFSLSSKEMPWHPGYHEAANPGCVRAAAQTVHLRVHVHVCLQA